MGASQGADNWHISIHALLAESDQSSRAGIGEQIEFLSTLSLRRATHYDNYNLHCVEISIHALLAESDWHIHGFLRGLSISIHALLAESDKTIAAEVGGSNHFYPRSPCGERHLGARQSCDVRGNFYPRSPCGERP